MERRKGVPEWVASEKVFSCAYMLAWLMLDLTGVEDVWKASFSGGRTTFITHV